MGLKFFTLINNKNNWCNIFCNKQIYLQISIVKISLLDAYSVSKFNSWYYFSNFSNLAALVRPEKISARSERDYKYFIYACTYIVYMYNSHWII